MAYAAFLRYGSFSHTNEYTLAALRERFHDLEIVDFDLKKIVSRRYLPLAGSVIEAVGRYGVRRLRSSGGKALALRTMRGWNLLNEAALACARERNGPPLFSFQTQTTFDGNVFGAPHFIYTDHAHLANLYYPTFRAGGLLDQRWIEAEAAALRRATGVFVMSKHVETAIRDLYHVEDERLDRVGVGYNAQPDAGAVARQSATVLFVGVEWERKGGDTLVDAMDIVVEQRPDARLVVVGCRPPVTRPYLEVLGRIPLADVSRHYREATLFCLPSRVEPFGIAPLEGMATGLPPVLPRLGAFPDFTAHGETGFLFPPGDHQALAGVLLSALDLGAERLGEIGERARAVVQKDYTWNAVGSRMERAIRARLGPAGTDASAPASS